MKRSGISMWLENRKNSWETRGFRGSERCSNFGRMMSVVIDDGDTASRLDLESPVDPPKGFKRTGNDPGLDAHIPDRCKGGCRIQYVVRTRNIKAELLRCSAVKSQCERRPEAFDIHIRDAHIGRSSRSVGNDSTFHLRNEGLHRRLIEVEDRCTIKRDLVDEGQEGRLNVFQVAIAIEVIRLDIGDNRYRRGKKQERPVAFISLEHDKLALAEPRVAADRIQNAADDYGWVESRPVENRSDHRSRRCLSMSARNRNAVFQAGKLGQHFSPCNDRNLASFGFLNFRIVGPDRRRSHHHMRAAHVFYGVARIDCCSTFFEALGDRRPAHIRAGHFVSEIEQEFSYPAHADTADPDKMYVLDSF